MLPNKNYIRFPNPSITNTISLIALVAAFNSIAASIHVTAVAPAFLGPLSPMPLCGFCFVHDTCSLWRLCHRCRTCWFCWPDCLLNPTYDFLPSLVLLLAFARHRPRVGSLHYVLLVCKNAGSSVTAVLIVKHACGRHNDPITKSHNTVRLSSSPTTLFKILILYYLYYANYNHYVSTTVTFVFRIGYVCTTIKTYATFNKNNMNVFSASLFHCFFIRFSFLLVLHIPFY